MKRSSMPENPLRRIPSVRELLANPALAPLVDRLTHNVVADGVRSLLDGLRRELAENGAQADIPDVDELAERAAHQIVRGERPHLRRVINATGILLHTGLGRAPLAREAVEALTAVADGYANVEVDLARGERSNRNQIVRDLLCELTGAESAVVVNNNAGATLLVLTALAAGRNVIVSRGQLIEIGGSFRLPEIMGASGAELREVGTTNKTRLSDYETAIDESTAALMRVHPSNFRVVGFTAAVPLDELVELGRRRGVTVLDDIGSGALVDFGRFGFRDEPVARESVAAGADVVFFSGDKLLGGPQAGIIVGERGCLETIGKHPLMRALRVDKLTYAALEATLRIYRDPHAAVARIPLLRLLSVEPDTLRLRADWLAERLKQLPGIAEAEAVEDVAFLGGGSIPAQEMATWCVALSAVDVPDDTLAARLRMGEPGVVPRVQAGRVRFDLRSVFPEQDPLLVTAVSAALETKESQRP